MKLFILYDSHLVFHLGTTKARSCVTKMLSPLGMIKKLKLGDSKNLFTQKIKTLNIEFSNVSIKKSQSIMIQGQF